jgi:pimeloyl-ACP methyl ester carboxylesterase
MALFTLEREGAAPPVVCLLGFCQSSEYWAPTLERLAATGMRGLAPDLPGFGRSASEPGPYTMVAMADAVVRLLDERGIDRIRLMGGSMGGVVAQQLVLRHPGRVERLLLVATGAVMADPVAGLAKADAMARAPWDETAIIPVVDGFFYRQPSVAEVMRLRRIALSASHRAAVEAARSNAQSNTMERLASIRVPTLIVQGRHDHARTPEHGGLMRERIADARLAVIEGAGHTPQLERPQAFHDIALAFLVTSTSAGARGAAAA